MWAWSADAWAALTNGRTLTAVSRVDVLHSGRVEASMVATGGDTETDADREVRANLRATLIDPTGRLSRGDVGDLLNAYECEIAPWRGVRWTQRILGVEYQVEQLAPLGVFGLTDRHVTDGPDGLTIRLAGQDRAMGYQGPMRSPVAIHAGTPVEVAVQQLLAARNRGLALLAMRTGHTVGPLIFEPESDVWAAAQKLAESVGARLFHDRTGQAVLAPAGAVSDRPVARYADGDGLLLDVDRSEDSDTIRNVVKAESATGAISVTVEDLDPASPTYSRGRYGEHVYRLKNPYFGSVAQARQAAATRLAYELGRSETVDFTAVTNPGLDVDDVVTVHDPDSGLVDRGLLVATVTVPLAAGEPMQVGCRQSRLAQDGRVLAELREVTA